MSKLSDFIGVGAADVEIVRKPTITSPSQGATGLAPSIDIEASQFAPIYSVDVRSYREFQVQVSGGDWTTLFYSNQVNSDADTFTGDQLTSYDIRVRDVLADGYESEWSDVVTVETADTSIDTPNLTVEGSPSDVPLTPTLTGSVFSVIGGTDTHQATDWEVRKASDNTLVWSSIGDTTNLTTIDVPASNLDVNTQYVFRVRYQGATYGHSGWAEVPATTVDIYVQNPTLSVEGSPSDVPETPTLTGSTFNIVNGTGTHQSTDWQILKQSDSSVVWESIGNTTNLEQITVPEGNILVSTGYIFRVRYNSGSYGSSDWVEVSASTTDTFGPPGVVSYDATTDTGFYGVETSASFITGDSLASQIGLSAGTSQNSSSDWLVFYVGENAPCNRTSPKYAYKLYVPMKTFRNTLSWNDINAVNAVYGDLNVTVGGETYECRLLTGAGADPYTDSDGIGSEWNELIYRVHQDVPTEQVGDNWANYTDCDLLVDSSCGDGSYSWCQETSSGDTSRRVIRGYGGVADFNTVAASGSYSNSGWRPGLAIPV